MIRFSLRRVWRATPALFSLGIFLFFTLTSASADDDQAKQDAAKQLAEDDQLSETDLLMLKGESIWNTSCADCHGAKAEGVEGVYEAALIGDDTVGQLAEIISTTMPEGEPEVCVAEDAEAVALWLHHNYYSEAARIRNRPPRVVLTHLTSHQLRQSLSDLYAHFTGPMWKDDSRGVDATYFDGSRWRKENVRFERVDPYINFDWGRESPGDGIRAQEFYVHWNGGLKIDESGRYEIVVRSTAAFTMEFGRNGRDFIDNHVQSGNRTEFRKSIYLLAGEVYPFNINLFQRKRKTEQPPVSFSLSWVTPHGTEQIIPTRNLMPTSPPPRFALQAKLPPDDRSYGYDRGLAVDRQWDESTTAAAVEFGSIAVDELWPSYERKHKKDSNENRARLRSFVLEVAEVAFRGPLSDKEKEFYVHEQINQTADDAQAIKRCMLTILKAPRFLYPSLDSDRSTSQQVANRLALVLYDSLPADQPFLKRIEKGTLEKEAQIRQTAWQMVQTYRCEGKIREMLFEWLNLSHLHDITKNSEAFPDFDQELVTDLKASLNAFLDEVVLSENSDFRQLFNANWAFSNPRLAKYYGDGWQVAERKPVGLPALPRKPEPTPEQSDEEPKADKTDKKKDDKEEEKVAPREPEPGKSYLGLIPVEQLRRTNSTDGKKSGILNHPYLMSGMAYTEATSPIHRGVFLIRYMLGRTLRPPNAAFSPLSPDLHPDLTTRERVELQTSPESCQVCHSKINGLGFTLEKFDPVGRFRKVDGSKPVDASGSYTDRNGQIVQFGGAEDLADYLAASDDAHRAFVNRAFQHFVKQPVAAFGPEKLDELTQKFKSSNYNIKALLVEIAVIAATPPEPTPPTTGESS